jgi:hypothetical protein
MHKERMVRKKLREQRNSGQNSQQKILFTISNPALKKGDVDVDDVNIDSDLDMEEEKNSVCSENKHDDCTISKQNMQMLNSGEAFKLPPSMTVNNKNHCKGPNIFLLRDQILSKRRKPLQTCLDAVKILCLTDIDNSNGVNFKTVLIDFANSLGRIGYQQVLNSIIELLQLRGDSSIIELLKKHIIREQPLDVLVDAYMHFEDRQMVNSPYTQYILKI